MRQTSLFKRPILLNEIIKLTNNNVFKLEFQDFVRKRQDIERSFKLVVDYLISDHEPYVRFHICQISTLVDRDHRL